MYRAICPGCGAILMTNISGQVWLGCQTCRFYGQVLATPPAAISSIPQSHGQGQAQGMASAGATTQPLTTPDQQRDALREDVVALASDVCERLRTLPPDDWNLTLIGAYERMQAAHTQLYTALGERHMGDYTPDTHKVAEAVVEVTMRLMLTLRAAERVGW